MVGLWFQFVQYLVIIVGMGGVVVVGGFNVVVYLCYVVMSGNYGSLFFNYCIVLNLILLEICFVVCGGSLFIMVIFVLLCIVVLMVCWLVCNSWLLLVVVVWLILIEKLNKLLEQRCDFIGLLKVGRWCWLLEILVMFCGSYVGVQLKLVLLFFLGIDSCGGKFVFVSVFMLVLMLLLMLKEMIWNCFSVFLLWLSKLMCSGSLVLVFSQVIKLQCVLL